MATLDGLRRQLEDKVQRCAAVVAQEVERELQQTAPVDSGELRRLIRTEVRKTVAGAQVKIESGAVYAQFVESHREAWDEMVRTLPDRVERVWRGLR